MSTRSYYDASLHAFLTDSEYSIMGAISAHTQFETELTQRDAWLKQIRILKQQLHDLDGGHIFFEFSIPRMGKRADVILFFSHTIYVIEFKVGAAAYLLTDIAQAVDYAVDLKNFHAGSHSADIVPILCATAAPAKQSAAIFSDDRVSCCVCCNAQNLTAAVIPVSEQLVSNTPLSAIEWSKSPYKPTPTIVQAAQILYSTHDVAEISRSDASAKNLGETTDAISSIIESAKANREKTICFVTGVPGAGKTLAGLNVTTSRMDSHKDEHAVFLSGNGPLVSVLRCALSRDESRRTGKTLTETRRNANAFIQNIHHFRDANLETELPPVEKVVVFDEAQRAWDREHTNNFMRAKKGHPDFDASEPEFLVQVMDRHADWCVIVALIGGGQEINSGEAGLTEWFSALRTHFPHWKIHFSADIESHDYIGDSHVSDLIRGLDANSTSALHLAVSVRSFRAEKLSEFVTHIINNSPSAARDCYASIRKNYPIFLTRDIESARSWVQSKQRGTESVGIIASSGAKRLRPLGLNVAQKIDPDVWFLNGAHDVRACQYLEEVATEFDIQGLELDWSIVGWDANLRRFSDEWMCRSFKGTTWQKINKPVDQQYLLNAYRVLLTRARQGFIVFVPTGNPDDPTRLPEFYDPIAAYLHECGIPFV